MSIEALLTALLASTIISSVSLTIASLGEAIGESAGLLNLGLEGIMLIAGFAGFWAALESGSLWLGLLASIACGAGAGLIFGGLVVLAKADQVIVGLAMTLAGGGLSGYLFREAYGSSQPLLQGDLGRPFRHLGGGIPVLGPAIINQKWIVFVTWALVPVVWMLMRRTRFGLELRAAGERPFAADVAGVDVTRVRLQAAVINGGFAGLAGGALAIAELGFFRPGITVGTGFIAVAITMVGRWDPYRIAVAALLFGLLRSAGTWMQITGVNIRPEFLQMLPYLGVILAIVVLARGTRLPSALGLGYRRGIDRT